MPLLAIKIRVLFLDHRHCIPPEEAICRHVLEFAGGLDGGVAYGELDIVDLLHELALALAGDSQLLAVALVGLVRNIEVGLSLVLRKVSPLLLNQLVDIASAERRQLSLEQVELLVFVDLEH